MYASAAAPITRRRSSNIWRIFRQLIAQLSENFVSLCEPMHRATSMPVVLARLSSGWPSARALNNPGFSPITALLSVRDQYLFMIEPPSLSIGRGHHVLGGRLFQ